MLLIYLPLVTPRSGYIFDVIFNHQLGIEYRTTTSIATFENHDEEKITYSAAGTASGFHVKATSLLSENKIRNIEIDISKKNGMVVLFPGDESCDLGFDIFSAAFYMLSRYEEYLPFTPDIHGRFAAAESMAFKNNFLSIPVVDEWARYFKRLLKDRFPSLKMKVSEFKAIATYDVDVAYKFKGRSLQRNMGATLKDLLRLDIKNIWNRFQTLYNNRQDPWDTYDYLLQTTTQKDIGFIFFFLLADKSAHNRNLDYKDPAVKILVNKIKASGEIGIHPSYESSVQTIKIGTEKERLEKLSGTKITKSRQHYLRFRLPDTYNALINAGINEDYSLGFSSMPGFRAGTCKPFYFYDLQREEATVLKIFPVTLMEGTFIDNMHSTPSDALKYIIDLINAVKNVEGTFISIWHNHTVSDTPEFSQWKKVHDEMIGFIAQIQAGDCNKYITCYSCFSYHVLHKMD